MTREYVHQELGQDVEAVAGYYTPLKEVKIKHEGRDLLYIVGVSRVESACCGGGTCSYVLVPGYIAKWKRSFNAAGLPVSCVEPVPSETDRREIAGVIHVAEGVRNIDFW